MTNVYVGGLPSHWSKDDLERLFEQFGEIAGLTKLAHRDYGLVDFISPADATKAIREMNGTFIEDKKIRVRLAHENSDRNYSRIENKPRHVEPRRSEERRSPINHYENYKREMQMRRREERERSPVEIVESSSSLKRTVDKVDNPAKQSSPKRSNTQVYEYDYIAL